MAPPMPISESVEIAATPAEVWDVVGDVTRMPQWSPELRRLVVLGRGQLGVGSRLLGLNRRGWVAWPTTSKITRFEPRRTVAWRTRESGATWVYELEASDGGTRLTCRREMPGYSLGTSVFGPVIGGAAGHDEELADGVRTTLQRIKTAVESAATA